MKVLGKRVLIEHKAEKKKSAVIVIGQEKNPDIFDMTFTVLALGDEIPVGVLQVTDKVLLGLHAQPNLVKTIKKTDTSSIYHVMVHYDDIEGIYEPSDFKKDGSK